MKNIKKRMKNMSIIKHNDLTHYFLRPHEQLPRAYLASCEKFFKELSAKQRAASIDKKFKSFKRQASSNKHQAASNPAGQLEVEKK